MTDDLVKRLREGTYAAYDQCTDAWLAADRIEQLEVALREIKGWNDNQDRRSLKIAAVIDAAIAGEKKE